MRISPGPTVGACLALLLFAATAAADTLLTTDGRVFEGIRVEGTADGVRLKFPSGVVVVPAGLVEKFTWDGDESAGDPERVRRARTTAEAISKLEWRNRRRIKTEHFVIEHTLTSRAIRGLPEMLDAFYEGLISSLGVESPPSDRPVVFLLRDSGQIDGVTAGRPGEICVAHRAGDPDLTGVELRRRITLYGLRRIVPEAKLDRFPARAYADCLAVGVDSGDGAFLESLRLEIEEGRLPGLEAVVTGALAAPGRAWEWSLARFLLTHEKYAAGFRAYLRLPRGSLAAFLSCLGTGDPAELRAPWIAWVKANLEPGTPREWIDAARAADAAARPRRATELYMRAAAEGHEIAPAWLRLAELLLADNDLAHAMIALNRAREIDPLDSRTIHLLGRVLSARGAKREGARLIRLAENIRSAMR